MIKTGDEDGTQVGKQSAFERLSLQSHLSFGRRIIHKCMLGSSMGILGTIIHIIVYVGVQHAK